ncbi:glycosyltransferase [Hamadaea tsunoensis]|uniref:glycosyltransferase n=1 Tax=Hamadaea tsunoensis TaxID=53368 RepID=UPI000686C0C7|nr:glycosyltransferase [Hamadaea tsunoensis]
MFSPRSVNAPATVSRLCLVGSYAAAEAGVSTFITDMRNALLADRAETVVDVVRTGAHGERDARSETVRSVGSSDEDSRSAATLMNEYDVVVIHYAADAYADDEGGQVLDILERVTVPVVCVMHDVHLEPTARQRFIIEMLTSSADAVVALTETSRRALLDDYHVEPRKLVVIRYGRLPAPTAHPAAAAGRTPTVLTWGRLYAGMGLELGIDAMARLDAGPLAPRYVLAGPIDDAYAQDLTRRAEALGIADRVELLPGYMRPGRLAEMVSGADMVLLPYTENDRTSSAILAEAVGAHKPVVSTPFPHACELLEDGRSGTLTPYADVQAMADAVGDLLADADRAHGDVVSDGLPEAGAQSWADAASQYRQLINVVFRSSSTASR